jgi:hypothetical protein
MTRGQTRPLVKEDALRRQTLSLKRRGYGLEPQVGLNTKTDRLAVIFSVTGIWLYSGTISEPTHFNTESGDSVLHVRLHEHKQCHITEDCNLKINHCLHAKSLVHHLWYYTDNQMIELRSWRDNHSYYSYNRKARVKLPVYQVDLILHLILLIIRHAKKSPLTRRDGVRPSFGHALIIRKAPQHLEYLLRRRPGYILPEEYSNSFFLDKVFNNLYQRFSMQGAAIVSWPKNGFKERCEKVLDLLNCLKMYLPLVFK